MANRCDCCGKFRKESDCIGQEETSSDGFCLDQYMLCRYCMSQSEEEAYFKKQGNDNAKKLLRSEGVCQKE